MWSILETIFYIVIFLLFLTTFMPERIQRRVSNSTLVLGPWLLHVAIPATFRAIRELAGAIWRLLGELVRAIEPHAYRLVTGQDFYAREARYQAMRQREDLHPAVRNEFPLPTAENTALHGGDPTVEGGKIAPATPEEVRALARALRHNLTSQDKTKSGAIKAGWGLSRSGTDPRYKRASELYDLATTPEEPVTFPELTPEKKRATPKAARV